MKLSYQLLIAAFVISFAGGLIWSANYYHTKYQNEKQRADTAENKLILANATITDQQTRQRDVAALDAKYTGELANAKATIEQLQHDVTAGAKRLRLSASCPGMPSTTSATSMDDAAGPRLIDSAQRDYFTLRERIETSNKMIAGLQDYIRQQCSKPVSLQ